MTLRRDATNFHGRSCSLIFRSRVGSLVSKKIPSPQFSPGSCLQAPASPPVLFANEYQKPPVLPRSLPKCPPRFPPRSFGRPRFSPGPPPVLPRFSPHSTPTAKISTRRADTVLASDCRAQFGRSLTRSGMSHLHDERLPVRRCRETMYCQGKTKGQQLKGKIVS